MSTLLVGTEMVSSQEASSLSQDEIVSVLNSFGVPIPFKVKTSEDGLRLRLGEVFDNSQRIDALSNIEDGSLPMSKMDAEAKTFRSFAAPLRRIELADDFHGRGAEWAIWFPELAASLVMLSRHVDENRRACVVQNTQSTSAIALRVSRILLEPASVELMKH